MSDIYCTSCLDTDIVQFAGGNTTSCPTSWYCDTMYIIDTFPNGGNTLNLIDCYSSGNHKAWTEYRQHAPTITSSPTISNSSANPAPAPATFSSILTPNSTFSTPPSHSSNHAWIAAAVIVLLAAFALITSIIWICLRCRRRRKDAQSREEQDNSTLGPHEKDGLGVQRAELLGNGIIPELGRGEHATQRMSELSGGAVYSSAEDGGIGMRLLELSGEHGVPRRKPVPTGPPNLTAKPGRELAEGEEMERNE